MGKHKLEIASSSGTKRMKSKTMNTDMEIKHAMLDQIHFPTCMYITMWATKKEEHTQMIKAKLNDFRQFNWSIVDLLVVKEIICNFQVHSAVSILRGKQKNLDSPKIT